MGNAKINITVFRAERLRENAAARMLGLIFKGALYATTDAKRF